MLRSQRNPLQLKGPYICVLKYGFFKNLIWTRVNENMKKAREQLISAAIGLFHEKSYARISLRDIGNKANITNSLIYHYFEDKEEILI